MGPLRGGFFGVRVLRQEIFEWLAEKQPKKKVDDQGQHVKWYHVFMNTKHRGSSFSREKFGMFVESIGDFMLQNQKSSGDGDEASSSLFVCLPHLIHSYLHFDFCIHLLQ